MFFKLLFICSVFIVFGVSVDGFQGASQTYDYLTKLGLIESSFYQNLDPTNQAEVLAIYENKQLTFDDRNKEMEEWIQKQPPQIQTAAKLYLQNRSQAYKDIEVYIQQLIANLSPAAKAFVQQEVAKINTENMEQEFEEYDQDFHELPPNVQQEIYQYNAQLGQFCQQTFNKYLSNRSKRYIHF
uniref:DUF148 domain-containing protein n=1 Tax=Acrobeloides nanus TaxID=290746 RepID=A0A914E3Q5_9BILA